MAPYPGERLDERDSLRNRIRRRQPGDLPLSAYVPGWAQAAIQLAVFVGSLWLLRSEQRPALVVLYAVPFGWAWFALLMVGHDAMHRAFVPWRRGNEVIAFLALDCLLFSRASWLYGHHVVHHARPHSSEDRMYLRGGSVAADMWNLLVMVLRYLQSDVTRLFRRPTWHEWLGMGVRVGLFWALLPLALLPAIVFLLFFGNYLGLLSHSLPVARRTLDPVLRQLRTTWDLFPGSFLASLATGGLNAHATHHVYPSLPRGAQTLGAAVLRDETGAEYRVVDTLAGLWTLFRMRGFQTADIETIEAIAAVRDGNGVSWLRPLAEDDPRVASVPGPGLRAGAPVNQRHGERRVRQVAVAFPERRQADRRSGAVRAAA